MGLAIPTNPFVGIVLVHCGLLLVFGKFRVCLIRHTCLISNICGSIFSFLITGSLQDYEMVSCIAYAIHYVVSLVLYIN